MAIYRKRRRSPDQRGSQLGKPARPRLFQSQARLVIYAVAPCPTPAPSINSPTDVVALLGDEMGALAQEQLRVLLLDTKHRVRACHLIYQGTVNGACIRVAEVVRPGVIANAPAILLVHNHPSGDPLPSPEDIHATQRIAEAATLLDIELLDHVILGAPGRCYSLKEAGLLRAPTPLSMAA